MGIYNKEAAHHPGGEVDRGPLGFLVASKRNQLWLSKQKDSWEVIEYSEFGGTGLDKVELREY